MKTIWKFELLQQRRGCITIQRGYLPVLYGEDVNGKFCLWAEVDTDMPYIHVDYMIIGTGQEAPQTYEYVATTRDDEPHLWHLYLNKNVT